MSRCLLTLSDGVLTNSVGTRCDSKTHNNEENRETATAATLLKILCAAACNLLMQQMRIVQTKYWSGPLWVRMLSPRPRGRKSLGHALLVQLLPLRLLVPEGLAGQRIRELLRNRAAAVLPSY